MLLSAVMTFTVLMLLAFGLYSAFNVKSQLTPIISVAILVDITVICGMFNLLKPGVIIAYAVAIAVFALGIYKNKENLKAKINDFLSPGVILFLIASIAMLAFMSIRQPLMTEWDEFSFWGISQKLVKINDQLYTYYKSSMIGNSTPPTLAVLSYLFQRFNPQFTEWISFFAYDVMFFACYSAFTALFDKKSWNSAVMVYIYGFLVPYVFEVYTKIIHLEPMYMFTYADIPLGVVFAGALAVYLFNERNDSSAVMCLLPVIVFLTYIKDMGFALSCIVAFIAFFDMIAGRKGYSFMRIKGLAGKIASGFVIVATALATFLSWSMHMARVMQRDPFALGGETNMGMIEMLIVGVKELLIGPKSEKFSTIMGYMADAFFKTKISFLGSGVVIFTIVTVLFIFAFIFNDKNGRRRSVMMWLTSLIGFIGYYVFHLFLYVYIFKDNGYDLVSYNRYIYPYYIGWLSLAVFALCLAIKNGKRFFAKTTLFCFSGIIFVLFNIYTSPEYLFVGCSDRNFALRRQVQEKVMYLEDRIGPNDVIYLYCGGDNGQRWFMYTHELASNYIVEDIGIDTSGMTEQQAKQAWRESLYKRFVEKGVTHIMIDSSSELFCYNYGDLFDVDMGYVGTDSVAYYKVNYENGFFNFTEVKGGVVR